jgi:hypothetical protein
MLRCSSTVVLFVVSLLAGSVGATPVTYEFSTSVNGAFVSYGPLFQPPASFPSLDAGDSSNLWGTLGEPISGTITLESSVPDSAPDPSFGNYVGVVLALSVNLNGSIFDYDPSHPGASSALQIFKTSTPGADGIFFHVVFGSGIFPTPPQDQYVVSFDLSVPNGITLGSDAFDFSLEPFLWSLGMDVSHATDQGDGDGSDSAGVSAQSALHYVPEPGVALLLGVTVLTLTSLRSCSTRG